jgi:hypothetical protein
VRPAVMSAQTVLARPAASADRTGPARRQRRPYWPGPPPGGQTWRSLWTTETVVSYAPDKGMPLPRRKPEDRPPNVFAVPNADLATGQVRHLDAVPVGVTQRALNPVST